MSVIFFISSVCLSTLGTGADLLVKHENVERNIAKFYSLDDCIKVASVLQGYERSRDNFDTWYYCVVKE